MSDRSGRYGFDAPAALVGLVAGAAVLLALMVVSFVVGVVAAAVAFLIGALYSLVSAASYVYTTRRGKFAVWRAELDRLALRGDEQLLDLGCGRGAVFMMAAKRLPKGRATGLDLWRRRDQSGNTAKAVRANARAEEVEDRIELVTGDMRALPFGDGAFDVAVSSLAIHNISSEQGREEAVTEALRVLAPGGRMLIADFQHTRAYETTLHKLGVTDLWRRDLGWRFWYGGPWFATWMLEARKPHQAEAPSNEVADGA